MYVKERGAMGKSKIFFSKGREEGPMQFLFLFLGGGGHVLHKIK